MSGTNERAESIARIAKTRNHIEDLGRHLKRSLEEKECLELIRKGFQKI
jgi:hypothetical protein